ncbi:MAG: glycosyltransferase family 4 protein [Thermoplasmata archaeon]|nr:glycosyltransferase family 4 protein [Thermoplasmata archaeon]
MRILEVTHRYPPALGGVELEVQGIARGLVARGHSVEVATTDLARDRPFARLTPGPPPDPFPIRRHRAFRTLPAPHGLGLVAPGMVGDVLRSRAQVVHAHAFGMAPTWIAAVARRVRRAPLVVETHFDAGRGTSGWRAYARAMVRLTLKPADRVVVHTTLEENLLASLGVDPTRFARITPGIDLAEFAGWPARAAPRSGVTALFIGRLDPDQKGLEPLVRALAMVPPSLGLRLRLVGEDWGGRDVVQRIARELRVDEAVTLTGPVSRPELLREFARADLFVLPSRFECTPAVLMEAMAAGLPIVSTRVGGIPEVVTEGENALLCPPNDPEALANALERLGGDAALRRRFRTAGIALAARFSWEQVIPLWVHLFEELTARTG